MLTRIAVLVPAHNEEELRPGCLAALTAAAREIDPVPVTLIVVADACTDGTAAAAAAGGARCVSIQARNVGAARAAGALIASQTGDQGLWIATTDADTRVPIDWFVRQRSHASRGIDVLAGTVTVGEWSAWPAALPLVYDGAYARRCGQYQHGHVHGANLSFTAAAYRVAGGFPARAVGEDWAFVTAALVAGLRISFATDLPVVTSARRTSPAPGGFSDYLARLEAGLQRPA